MEKTHTINGQSLAVKKAMPKEQTVSGSAMSNHNAGYGRGNRSNFRTIVNDDNSMQRERGRFNNNFNENLNYNQNNNDYNQSYSRFSTDDYSDEFVSNNHNNFHNHNGYNNFMNNNGPRMDSSQADSNRMSAQQMPNNLANFALLAQKMLQNFNAAGVSFPSMPSQQQQQQQQQQQFNRPPFPPPMNIDRNSQLNSKSSTSNNLD